MTSTSEKFTRTIPSFFGRRVATDMTSSTKMDENGKHPFEIRHPVSCLRFNLAMQAAAEAPHKGVTLRRLLDNNAGPFTTVQRTAILSAMSKVLLPSTPDITHTQVLQEKRTLILSHFAHRSMMSRDSTTLSPFSTDLTTWVCYTHQLEAFSVCIA